jgi:hypothetical protein
MLAHPQARQLQQWGGLFPFIPSTVPQLATSNFCLFGPLKDALPAQHFADDKLKHEMREEL